MGALSPAAQSGVERCRLLLGPLRLSLRDGYLEKREKGAHPVSWSNVKRQTRVLLPGESGPGAGNRRKPEA